MLRHIRRRQLPVSILVLTARDDASSAAPWSVALVQRKANLGYRQKAEALRRAGRPLPRMAADGPTDPAGRLREIETARSLLPLPSEIHWAETAPEPLPFLFFRTGESGFAVYDPAMGTASARSETKDADRLVAAVAKQLGYRLKAGKFDRELAESSPSSPTRSMDRVDDMRPSGGPPIAGPANLTAVCITLTTKKNPQKRR